MELMFIEAKSDADIKKAVENAIRLLPKKVGIVTTAQHKHKLKEIKKILENKGIKAEIGGQILGCNASAAKKIKADTILYVGSGRFHPIEVALETGKKVVMANPLTNETKVLEKDIVEKLQKQQKGALMKFLASDNIGIIVSTKSGQEKLKKAMELKKRLKNKNCYIFMADTINPAEFENFPFIESWINTACPRFADEKKGVVNYEVVEKSL
ncbi:MAG: diphthamide synthesis protein [Candidatus Woesearchaeota archaeon]